MWRIPIIIFILCSIAGDGATTGRHGHLEEIITSTTTDSPPSSVVVLSTTDIENRHHSPNYHHYTHDDNNDDHRDHHRKVVETHTGTGNHKLPPRRFQVAKFDFEHVSTPYIISLWIIIVGLAKIGFHVTPKLSSICPESVMLMILGVIIGLIMFMAGIPEERLQPLTPNLFFLYMLPPIVMDAGYHMPNRLFFDNLVSILLYAVVGTIWNALAIGLSLYGCSRLGLFGDQIPFLDIMLFSSTVSAVDPVAVLAVFEEIHVNEVLYILVFGESLLNDGVTVVLYHMFEGYAEIAYHYGIDSIQYIDYISGAASFFVVAIGGTAMGIFWGFLAAFVSRFTHHVKIIEPIFVFVLAYLSYLSAEMFHLSGILSLTFCGITMKNYVEENITQKSHTTLKYAMKMLAHSSEAIIFVFLGVCTVNDQHHWNTAFVTLTIIFCLLYRTLGVIGLTWITNHYRLHKVNPVEQFIMAYGGLRGAVAFALILIINRQIIHAREMMVTTIIAVVYFTVFLQGMTVGSLVKILNVPRANKFELTMNERIHTRLMDHVMAGLEDISGMMMGNYKIRDKFRHFNNRYLRTWLLRNSKETGNSSRKIFETLSRLNLRDAMTMVSRPHFNMASNQTNGVAKISRFVTSDINGEDLKNNHNVGGTSGSGGSTGGGPPTILLTVPGNPALATNPDVDGCQTLTSLFRSYTQSNLSGLNDEQDTDDDPTSRYLDPNSPTQLILANLGTGNIKTPGSSGTDLTGTDEFPATGSTGADFNYDIGTIVYCPSLKDVKDAELHHILNDAMFKPFKKAHHYTRGDYQEEPVTHPPFKHQVRMQIRRLFSLKEMNRRRRHSHHPYPRMQHHHRRHSHHPHHHRHHHQQQQQPQSDQIDGLKPDEMISKDGKRSRSETDIEMKIKTDPITNNDTDDDTDDGIMFTVHQSVKDNNDSTTGDTTGQPPVPPVMANFPWQRSSPIETDDAGPDSSITSASGQENDDRHHHHHHHHRKHQPHQDAASRRHRHKSSSSSSSTERQKIKEGVVRQREFPPWIKNPDYVDDYGSPTTTLLERINFFNRLASDPLADVTIENQNQPSKNSSTKKIPSVYEIFQLDEKNSNSQKNQTKKPETESIDQFGSNDTVIEFLPSNDDDDEQGQIDQVSKL